jgi:prepilin-type N-terminal cleavage/methylation domain-containing protein
MKKSPANKSGFTLIEIVIVLAIAALIMVIVFVAVSGAQRSRRDTERRAVASRVLASLVNCASDNSGTIGGTNLCASYITGAVGTGNTGTLGGTLPTTGTQTVYIASTGGCPATQGAVTTAISGGSATGVYYWSEANNAPVCIASTI